jgi:hypothetical protein
MTRTTPGSLMPAVDVVGFLTAYRQKALTGAG